MEISNEIKAKVYAQYLGNKIYWQEKEGILSAYNLHAASTTIEESKLILKPISELSNDDAIKIAKIKCGNQYIEPHNYEIKFLDTTRDNLNILKIEFDAYEQIKHTGDKPKKIIIHISNWGSIATYVDGALGNNNKAYFIYQYLIEKGYDLPQQLLKGKTLQESGLAIYEN